MLMAVAALLTIGALAAAVFDVISLVTAASLVSGAPKRTDDAEYSMTA
jgi:hypothetical protein